MYTKLENRKTDLITSYCGRALQELERNFGKATTIVNAYKKQLLDQQPPIKGNPESNINNKTFLKGVFRNLQHLEHTDDLESTTIIKKILTSGL